MKIEHIALLSAVVAILLILWLSPYLRNLYKRVQQRRSENLGRTIYNAFQLDTLKTKLEAYGKVEQCEEKNGMFYVKITDGFMPHFFTIRACVADINNFVGPAYPYQHKMATGQNLFILVLKPDRK